MYVRDAKNREEVWLLDHIEAMDLDGTAFRSRDYVVAIDEESGEKAGFGRIREHTVSDGADVCELTSIGVLESWRGRGVGAHVIERLVEYAGDDGHDAVYALTGEPAYLEQFGFEPIDRDSLPEPLQERITEKRATLEPDAAPMAIDVAAFRMPDRLREAFKRADDREEAVEDQEETAEDFGIDPETATYKYDTGR